MTSRHIPGAILIVLAIMVMAAVTTYKVIRDGHREIATRAFPATHWVSTDYQAGSRVLMAAILDSEYPKAAKFIRGSGCMVSSTPVTSASWNCILEKAGLSLRVSSGEDVRIALGALEAHLAQAHKR